MVFDYRFFFGKLFFAGDRKKVAPFFKKLYEGTAFPGFCSLLYL